MATTLIVVALLVGGLGAIRWRRHAGSNGPVATGSDNAAAASATNDGATNDGATNEWAKHEPATHDGPATKDQPTADKPSTTTKRGRRPGIPGPPTDDLLAASADADDLDAAFDRVLESHSRELGILLASRLQRLVDRRVPVRAIRDAPGTSARVCFADGTIVLVRGVVPGDFVRIAWGMHAGSVWLQGFSRVDATTRLDLRWHEGRVAVVAIGLDQPD